MNSKSNLSKLSRAKSHRKSLMRNMVTSLVLYEHMKTTKAKSKLVLQNFDRIINTAKQEDKRKAKKDLQQFFYDDNAVAKAMDILAKRFDKEDSGYVHVYKLGRRKGDNAEMVKLLVKGYEYKEIGKGNKKQAKANEIKEERKQEVEQPTVSLKQDNKAKSQVKDASPTRVKSRSGI